MDPFSVRTKLVARRQIANTKRSLTQAITSTAFHSTELDRCCLFIMDAPITPGQAAADDYNNDASFDNSTSTSFTAVESTDGSESFTAVKSDDFHHSVAHHNNINLAPSYFVM